MGYAKAKFCYTHMLIFYLLVAPKTNINHSQHSQYQCSMCESYCGFCHPFNIHYRTKNPKQEHHAERHTPPQIYVTAAKEHKTLNPLWMVRASFTAYKMVFYFFSSGRLPSELFNWTTLEVHPAQRAYSLQLIQMNDHASPNPYSRTCPASLGFATHPGEGPSPLPFCSSPSRLSSPSHAMLCPPHSPQTASNVHDKHDQSSVTNKRELDHTVCHIFLAFLLHHSQGLVHRTLHGLQAVFMTSMINRHSQTSVRTITLSVIFRLILLSSFFSQHARLYTHTHTRTHTETLTVSLSPACMQWKT